MVARFEVPLLSQEGLTCRLLSGATAPCPAAGSELTFEWVEILVVYSGLRAVLVLVFEQ